MFKVIEKQKQKTKPKIVVLLIRKMEIQPMIHVELLWHFQSRN